MIRDTLVQRLQYHGAQPITDREIEEHECAYLEDVDPKRIAKMRKTCFMLEPAHRSLYSAHKLVLMDKADDQGRYALRVSVENVELEQSDQWAEGEIAGWVVASICKRRGLTSDELSATLDEICYLKIPAQTEGDVDRFVAALRSYDSFPRSRVVHAYSFVQDAHLEYLDMIQDPRLNPRDVEAKRSELEATFLHHLGLT